MAVTEPYIQAAPEKFQSHPALETGNRSELRAMNLPVSCGEQMNSQVLQNTSMSESCLSKARNTFLRAILEMFLRFGMGQPIRQQSRPRQIGLQGYASSVGGSNDSTVGRTRHLNIASIQAKFAQWANCLWRLDVRTSYRYGLDSISALLRKVSFVLCEVWKMHLKLINQSCTIHSLRPTTWTSDPSVHLT